MRTRRSRPPSKNIPIAERPGWGKDYADALTFFSPLFDGRTIIPNGNTNYSLVGITPAQCKTLKVTGNCTNVPSVDNADRQVLGADRRPAHRLLREPRQEPDDEGRAVGAVAVGVGDRITSTNVTKYQFDQFRTTPACVARSRSSSRRRRSRTVKISRAPAGALEIA